MVGFFIILYIIISVSCTALKIDISDFSIYSLTLLAQCHPSSSTTTTYSTQPITYLHMDPRDQNPTFLTPKPHYNTFRLITTYVDSFPGHTFSFYCACMLLFPSLLLVFLIFHVSKLLHAKQLSFLFSFFLLLLYSPILFSFFILLLYSLALFSC